MIKIKPNLSYLIQKKKKKIRKNEMIITMK